MEDTLDNRIWDSVQTEPTYSSNPSDYVDHWKRFLDAELASLREQLKEKQQQLNASLRNTTRLLDRIKQKEEVIKELIPIAERMAAMCRRRGKGEYGYKVDSDKYKLIIDKAKKLVEPQ